MRMPFVVAFTLATTLPALAGPLTPPGGAPTSTYKTLTEVEPRLAVNTVNAPPNGLVRFSITAPGSYYLTGNITLGGGIMIAIRINSDDVTLDLNGFTIAESQHGVHVESGNRCVIKNGRVLRTSSSGILISSGVDHVVRDVTVSQCGQSGLRLLDPASSVSLYDSVFHGNTGTGASLLMGARGEVVRCTAFDNTSRGFDALTERAFVKDSVSYLNGQVGFLVGQGAVLIDCAARDNQKSGFEGGRGTRFEECVSEGNAEHGFLTAGRALVQGCQALDNTLWGVQGTTLVTVTGSTIMSNGSGGIVLGDNANVLDNIVSDNGATIGMGPGIEVTGDGGLIDANSLQENAGFALDITGTRNRYQRNTFHNNNGGGIQGAVAGGNADGGMDDGALGNFAY